MRSKIFSIVFRVAISAVLLYFVFWRVDVQDVLLSIQKINILYFLVAVALVSIGTVVAAFRWHYILRSWYASRFLFKNLLPLFLISFFYSLFLPGGQAIGEVVKAYRISHNIPDKTQVLYSILVDRLIGFVALFPLIFIAFFSISNLQTDFVSIVIIIASAVLAFSSVLLLVSSRIAHGTIRFIFFLISFFRKRTMALSQEVILLRRYMPRVLGLAILNHIIMGVSVLVLARGVGVEAPFYLILWIYLVAGVVSFFPISYAGFGPREFVFIYFLSLVGVAPAQALAVSLLFAIVNMLVALTGFFLELKFLFIGEKEKIL